MTERSVEDRFVEAMREMWPWLRSAEMGDDGPFTRRIVATVYAFADAVCNAVERHWIKSGTPSGGKILIRPCDTCRANLLKRVMGGER